MDIGAISSTMSQAKVAQQVSISVLKMSMNTAEQTSASMVAMMEKSLQPHLGSLLDIKA
ncbi:YjfB family protein [Heliophilum fasciatum]|uniref:Putative motility protein YjfB-like n=1 Tax=Heliophilum fasciatum TaxID=35700 RepID=A0A4R2RKP2_9FIRM|nr:YjfB family protein [Heliophilum fasciatum]MCW2277958.1 hypothetical protein [Heliophilum fasciatum]TCP64472.1 putative motility protein YjfB-like [Heliophilum fasciatum]